MSIPPNGILKPEWELTDEEIQQACRSGFVWFPVVSTADRNIAQAAQKKLVEWLKTKGFYHDVGVLSGTTKVILPIFAIEEENWQELCKGVK